MVEVRVSMVTDLPADAVLAAATDFTDRRPAIWTDLDPKVYRVEALGERDAVVVEGSRSFGGIWAREAYDWSRPGVVRSEVLESNVFAPGSWWELRATQEGGETRVEWISHRVARGARGRLVTAMLRLAGAKYLAAYVRKTMEGLEATAETG